MYARVGDTVAPPKRLPVQVGVVTEAYRRPEVAPHVYFTPLFTSPFACALYNRISKPTLRVKSSILPFHCARPSSSRPVPSQNDYLRVVVQATPRHSTEVVEGVQMTPDEGRDICRAHALHIDRPRPAHHHHECPHTILTSVLSYVTEDSSVNLRLLTG